MTHDELVAALRAAEVALGDGKHLATDGEKEKFYRDKASYHRELAGLLNTHDPDKHEIKLVEMQRVHPILLEPQAKIEELITDMGDYRRIADPKERSKAWAHREGLLASKDKIVHGVEWTNGIARVPSPLKEMLGTEMMSDGRQWNTWHGSLTEIEAEIKRLTPLVEARRAAYATHVKNAEAIVSVTV